MNRACAIANIERTSTTAPEVWNGVAWRRSYWTSGSTELRLSKHTTGIGRLHKLDPARREEMLLDEPWRMIVLMCCDELWPISSGISDHRELQGSSEAMCKVNLHRSGRRKTSTEALEVMPLHQGTCKKKKGLILSSCRMHRNDSVTQYS